MLILKLKIKIIRHVIIIFFLLIIFFRMSHFGQYSHYGQSEEPEDELHEINTMLAKLTMECLIEEERGEDILLQWIILIMLEDDCGIFMNRFINAILEVFNVFKENDFKYPELFVLCSSVIKKEKLQNIPAPQVYHEWVEVIEKITDQWWNSDTF